jgi:hypothetical protein
MHVWIHDRGYEHRCVDAAYQHSYLGAAVRGYN